ncbi:hypothetical protein AHAS_Ahas01G0245500 [Arachis hypogaea]
MEEVESVFNTFDIVSEISNHHFLLLDEKDSSFSNAKSSVYTHIMKEWKILEEHLPDSIYVRVYESRIDLMRAVIVGTAGTPYHDGLFFFDIKLSSKYPNNSLILYFHSFRLGLNLNFYNSGKAHVATRKSPGSQAAQKLRSLHQEPFSHPGCHHLSRVPRVRQWTRHGWILLRQGSITEFVMFEDEDEQENNSDENKGGRKIIVMASPKDKRKVRIFKKVVARIKRTLPSRARAPFTLHTSEELLPLSVHTLSIARASFTAAVAARAARSDLSNSHSLVTSSTGSGIIALVLIQIGNLGSKVLVPSKNLSRSNYHDLSERPFSNELCNFLSSRPVIAMVTD